MLSRHASMMDLAVGMGIKGERSMAQEKAGKTTVQMRQTRSFGMDLVYAHRDLGYGQSVCVRWSELVR
jgi:hypothetical protein